MNTTYLYIAIIALSIAAILAAALWLYRRGTNFSPLMSRTAILLYISLAANYAQYVGEFVNPANLNYVIADVMSTATGEEIAVNQFKGK